MPLYQILNSNNQLKPFPATELSSRYVEKNLEDWLEAKPEVEIIHTDVWFIMTYPANDEFADEAAEIIINKILPRVG